MAADEIDVDEMFIPPGVFLIGNARRIEGNRYICLADFDGALVRVKVMITIPSTTQVKV